MLEKRKIFTALAFSLQVTSDFTDHNHNLCIFCYCPRMQKTHICQKNYVVISRFTILLTIYFFMHKRTRNTERSQNYSANLCLNETL